VKPYEEIEGWFDHLSTYDFLLNTIPENGVFVEIGAWLGRSSAYLCDQATNQNIVIVDTWLGSVEERQSTHILATQTDIYKMFVDNMGARKYKAIRSTSKEASEQFQDNSVDVVFIDGDHSYAAVHEDITSWMPKVKPGGYIAGHDYHPHWHGVVRAVNELVPQFTVDGQCWIHQKPVT